ncbi:MAG: ribosome assembly cofactor RimP [Spirochaetaceae bacterium]|jgi:ribosome maturation factor RimP|nr:ribosome assembly cofactor RimP [Spirochaetaceae bacterium]
MRYRAREEDRETAALRADIEPVLGGLGFALVELNLFRPGKGAASVRLVLTRPGAAGIGTEELAGAHRAVLPRLETAFPGGNLHLELSSPGTDRLIKEGAEFRFFRDKPVRCYRTDSSRWCAGILRGSDEEKIVLETPEEGVTELAYTIIAKAKLDDR